jgi:hypothetical protein
VEEKLNGRFAMIAFIDLFREIDESGVEKSPGNFLYDLTLSGPRVSIALTGFPLKKTSWQAGML